MVSLRSLLAALAITAVVTTVAAACSDDSGSDGAADTSDTGLTDLGSDTGTNQGDETSQPADVVLGDGAVTISGKDVGAVDLSSLPLGNDSISTTAEQGKLWLCNQMADEAPDPNVTELPWVFADTGTYDLTAKVFVEGDVAWPDAAYSTSVEGENLAVATNDLPINHTTGVYPVGPDDPAIQYRPSQSSIVAHDLAFDLPVPRNVGVSVHRRLLPRHAGVPGPDRRDAVGDRKSRAARGSFTRFSQVAPPSCVPPTRATTPGGTMAFNTRIAAVAVAAAVAGGGAAFLVAPAIGSAQEDTSDTPSGTTDGAPQLPGGEQPDGTTGSMPGAPQGTESGASCAPGGAQGGGPGFEAAAEAIGIDVDELTTELQSGATIAEVAEANGADVDDVIAAMVDDAESQLAAGVEEGRLSEDEAAEIAADLAARIAEMVENGPQQGGPMGQGGPQGGMPGGGQSPSGDQGSATTPTSV
jgi:hypothetical protein